MIPPPPEPTLPEELLLLAPDPRRGRPYCRSRFLEYAMAGAALAELSLQGWITEERGRALAALVSAADQSRFVAADRTRRGGG
ncbi:Golgi phosphoprotein 3 GPP34 [Streptomyces sp. CEV 2-1]|uniref:GPP34 family phosphoprotein n=1 Tax=Streptomyces sp. CEV 2-1 TaxID=2485153 RepID=UPI000F486EA0|nr:Golgi phosphoprotein 3 GPP34 [Streptomyces sp. CEV 2-1]